MKTYPIGSGNETPKEAAERLRLALGEVDAARFFLDCLQSFDQLPVGSDNQIADNAGVRTANPDLYGNFWRDARRELSEFRDTVGIGARPVMLDLGGGKGETAGFREGFDYRLLDIDPLDPHATTISHDLNEPFPIESGSVDVVFCNQVFEHLVRPWDTAKEIGRILRPGGLCLTSTVFSYRYHPFPTDNWRFTHEGLRRLMETFGALRTKHCRYELTHRRDDRRGALGHPDEVHVDWLGGFRENWFVYFIGYRPRPDNNQHT